MHDTPSHASDHLCQTIKGKNHLDTDFQYYILWLFSSWSKYQLQFSLGRYLPILSISWTCRKSKPSSSEEISLFHLQECSWYLTPAATIFYCWLFHYSAGKSYRYMTVFFEIWLYHNYHRGHKKSIHCGPVMPYNNIDLGHHWFK